MSYRVYGVPNSWFLFEFQLRAQKALESSNICSKYVARHHQLRTLISSLWKLTLFSNTQKRVFCKHPSEPLEHYTLIWIAILRGQFHGFFEAALGLRHIAAYFNCINFSFQHHVLENRITSNFKSRAGASSQKKTDNCPNYQNGDKDCGMLHVEAHDNQ